MSITHIQSDTSANITRVTTMSSGNYSVTANTAGDPQLEALDNAREYLLELLSKINDRNRPSEAALKAAFDKYETARGVVMHRLESELKRSNLTEAEKAERLDIIKNTTGDSEEILALLANAPTERPEDMVWKIIEATQNGPVAKWLEGLKKYVAFNEDLAALNTIISGAFGGGEKTMSYNGKMVLEEIRKLVAKYEGIEYALCTTDKSGDEALKDIQAKARELGQNDSYNYPFPSNIIKTTRPDGSVTYHLTVNLNPLRQMEDSAFKHNNRTALTMLEYQELTNNFATQKEVSKYDVTTFSTKTGDITMKLDNTIKALMAFLAARLESGKNFVS